MDQTGDNNGVELHRLSQIVEFPAFVKSADIQGCLSPPATLASTAFADQASRLYPCHTAASTWLSAAYYYLSPMTKRAARSLAAASDVERRLEKFAEYFRIVNAFEAIRTAAKTEKQAVLDDDCYTFVWTDDAGNKQRKCPLRNPTEIKAAADWLMKYRDSFTFGERQLMAEKILTKSAEFGVWLDTVTDIALEKQAGHGVCDPAEVHAMLINRARLMEDTAIRNQVTKLAETVRDAAPIALGPDMLRKLAVTIDCIDRATKMVGRYSSSVPRPEDVLFGVTYKEAGDVVSGSCETTTGNIYSKSDIGRLKLSDVQDMFGNEFAEEVSSGLHVDPEKMATIVATLPRGDAQMFDHLMSAIGASPLISRKTAGTMSLSMDRLAELATLSR